MACIGMHAHAQNCVINHIQNPSFDNTAPLFSVMGAQVPNWNQVSGTPDIYPNGTIFMWGTSEAISQNLCQPLVAGQNYNFSIDAHTTSRNFGNMIVELRMAGGGTVQTIMSTGLTNTAFLTFPFGFTAADNYDQIRIYPQGSGGVMDIIVDNVLIQETIATSGTTQYHLLNCCEEQELTISDQHVPYTNIEWYELGAGSPFATGTSSVLIFPAPPQSTYIIKKEWLTCSDSCTVFDTIIVDCIDLWTLPSSRPANQQGSEINSPKETLGNVHITDMKESPSLEQNIPNPFNEATVIRYHLTQPASEAFILLYDMKGTQLKKYTLTEQGKGQVTISSGELSPGMYIYSLVIDGEAIDTKRMLLLGE